MGSPMIIPFNFQPVNTVVGTTASYTVPAGKYAKVSITASASSRLAPGSGSSSQYSINTLSASSNSDTKDIMLKSGDVLTSSLTNASGSHSTSTTVITQGSSESVVNVMVNGVVIFSVRAPISTGVNTTSNPAVLLCNYTGSTSVGYIASEYNNLA